MDEDRTDEQAKFEELEKRVEEDESHHELFSEKVRRVGAIHTTRALLANRLGRLKLEILINREEVDEAGREKVAELEEELGGISGEITDFSPKTLDDLDRFEEQTNARLDDLGGRVGEAEKRFAGDNPVI